MPEITPQPSPTCHTCGSKLILVSTRTEQLSNAFSPTTVNVYRCSNTECQDEKDRLEVVRLKAKDEKDKAREKHLAEKAEAKK